MKFIEMDAAQAFEIAIESYESSEKNIVCGSQECVEYIKEGMEDNKIIESETIASADKISAEKWFEERALSVKSEFEEDEWDFSEIIGEWPDSVEEKLSFSLNRDVLTGELLDKVFVAKVFASNSAEILLKFKYGGWNDCPSTEEHMAIWKCWEEKYGAKIVGVGNDVIEAYVTNPPETKEEAMKLAFEQYYYCCDIVDQGCESISNLASTLLKSDVWFFWWD